VGTTDLARRAHRVLAARTIRRGARARSSNTAAKPLDRNCNHHLRRAGTSKGFDALGDIIDPVMRRLASWSLFWLVACRGGSQPTSSPSGQTDEPAGSATGPSQDALPDDQDKRACLPLILNDTCVMPCSAGTRDASGQWRLDFWRNLAVNRVTRCGDAGCTEVFVADMAMGGVCMKRESDRACRFVGSSCEGAAREPNWPPP
jgi:hypothetical protein